MHPKSTIKKKTSPPSFIQAKKIGSNIITNAGTWDVHDESVNQDPWNILEKVQASPEVSHDMLALRTIG